MDEIFIERVQELIKKSKIKYEDLAKQLDFKSKGTISKYANGKIVKIGPTGIAKIADFFHVSPAWLAGFSDDKYYNMKK